MADWPPKRNSALTLTFPIYDNDGDLVSSAAGLDSEVSVDSGAFNDCTNEAAEIGASGMYTLQLTAGEMNGDIIAVIVKTATASAKTAVMVVYTATRQLVDMAYPAVSGRAITVSASGDVTAGTVGDKTGYTLTSADHASIADRLLGRNLAGGSDSGRTVRQALRILRNLRQIVSGTLTVYQEDDTTVDWTATVTQAPGDPVNKIDPG